MDQQEMMRYLHRHYVAWLLQGQWEPELSMPEGSYPLEGEWIRLEWRFSEPVPQERWEAMENAVESCFSETCELWAACRGKQVSALAMAKTLSTPEKQAQLWVAAIQTVEELQLGENINVICRISEACDSYQTLANVQFLELNAWWTQHCAIPPQERREHRKRIQNYLKKGQFGHISGYVSRCLKRQELPADFFWFWIPLVMESLWIQHRPSMSLLMKHLRIAAMEREGASALISWLRKTCVELKADAMPEDPIERVTESIQRDCSLPFSQTNLAEGLGLTPAYFSRLFEKRTGVRFSEYLTAARISRARELLCGNATLAEIAQASGFQRKSYFCEVFRKHVGMTAMEYRTKVKRGDAE